MGEKRTGPYAAGFFQMIIDDDRTTSYLKSVEGGHSEQEFISERIGEHQHVVNHSSVANVSEVSFEFGLSGAKGVLKWIQSSWERKFCTRSGQIDHADFDTNIRFTQEFSNALITETTFPVLDGASKEGGYIKVKFAPEAVAESAGEGRLDPNTGVKQKLWNCSAFRFQIDGVDGLEFTNKIESFTVKQGVKKLGKGIERFQELMPTKIEFPQIIGTIAEAYASGLKDWNTQYVGKGKKDPKAQKTGTLEFLAPNKADVLFRINMYGIGLKKLEPVKSTANSQEIKRLKYTLMVERMELDGREGFE